MLLVKSRAASFQIFCSYSLLNRSLPKASEGNVSFELMIIFAAINGLPDVLAERWRVNKIEQMQASDNVVVFPQCLFSLVGAGMKPVFW